MAIKTPEELRTALSGVLGDAPSDAGLALLEDMSDTLTSLTGSGSAADWEQKYKDNDAAWRQKYTERFFAAPADQGNGGNTETVIEAGENEVKSLTYEDLFKEG